MERLCLVETVGNVFDSLGDRLNSWVYLAGSICQAFYEMTIIREEVKPIPKYLFVNSISRIKGFSTYWPKSWKILRRTNGRQEFSPIIPV